MAYLLFRFRGTCAKGAGMAGTEKKVSGDDRIWNFTWYDVLFCEYRYRDFPDCSKQTWYEDCDGAYCGKKNRELTNVPMLCTGMAMTTYASQNLGAGEYDRIKKGIHQAFVIVLVQGVIFTTFCWIFGYPLIRWITSSNDTYILDTAYRYLTRNTSFYFVLGPLFVLSLFSSGAGT